MTEDLPVPELPLETWEPVGVPAAGPGRAPRETVIKMDGLGGRSELEREAALRTPTQVRNLVVLWYYNAFKDNLLAAKKRLGVPANEERAYESAVGSVRLAFKEAGADFNHPTRDSLRSVVRLLSRRTRNWPKQSGDKAVHRELLKLVRHLK